MKRAPECAPWHLPLVHNLARALAVLVLLAAACAKRTGGPQVGDQVPDVAAPASDGAIVHFRQLTGHPVVLFFYPKDGTSGCTSEACSLRDHYQDIQAAGATVLGVSTQDSDSHKKFA